MLLYFGLKSVVEVDNTAILYSIRMQRLRIITPGESSWDQKIRVGVR